MSVLLSLVSFLLVMAAGGGRHAHLATAEDTVVPNSAHQVIAYWQTVLPNSPMPSAILELLDPPAGENKIGEHNIDNNPTARNDYNPASSIPFFSYKRAKHNPGSNYIFHYGKATKGPASSIPFFFYKRAKHNPSSNYIFHYGKATKGASEKSPAAVNEDDQNSIHDLQKSATNTQGENKIGEHNIDNNPTARNDYNPASSIPFFSYKRAKHNPGSNYIFHYGKATKGPASSIPFFFYKRAKHNPSSNYIFHYGKATKGASEKSPAAVNEDDQNSIHDLQKSATNTQGGGHEHVHGDGDGQVASKSRGLFFFEDELVPGSMVTACVVPTNPHRSKLLNREIADSIPFSSKNFTRIITMFAPESVAMADDIKFTLEVCENPVHLKGEKKGCATSVESLVELATSILETPDIRAFSSDAPMEGMPAQQYKLNAVRKVSDSLKIVTCHDMTFPYMVFFCHMTYPSRAYLVTLASDDGSPAREAVAMCHLDTSSWDPNHVFFQLKHVKPGETTACHFLNRGAIVWAPAGNQEELQAAA